MRCENSCHYQVLPGKDHSSNPSPQSTVNTPVGLPWDISSFPSPSLSQTSQQGTFTASDLELMHHYSTTSFLPMRTNHRDTQIWQRLAPEEAFKHRFLLYGILAISALHKAYMDPESASRNTLLATQHYTTAIGLFRPVINDIRADNAVAAFMLSGLVVCISWALPMGQPDSQGNTPPLTAVETLQHVLDMIRLQRGVREIVSSGWEWTRVLAPIFNLKCNEPDAVFPAEDEVILKALKQRIDDEAEVSKKATYATALQQFRKFYPLEDSSDQHSLVHAWPTQVSQEFLNEMAERKPLAVIFLAYHGVLLHGLKSCWWVNNKGRMVVDMAEQLLPSGYEDIMQWLKMRAGLGET